MINAILIDDEPINISNLEALLLKHCPEVHVVDTAGSAAEASKKIIKQKPDVIFLDIEMPGKNGFELLREFPHPDFEVVFVTAYDAYGVMAIKFSALDYILKPINIQDLKTAVSRVKKALADRNRNTRLNNLIQFLDRSSINNEQKIALPTQKETFLVPVKDIVRCESSNNYTAFYLSNGQEYLISRPLYEYDELLSPYGFLRCHQSHLVNKAHVKSILNEDSGYLMMSLPGKKVPISRQRKAEILEKLKF